MKKLNVKSKIKIFAMDVDGTLTDGKIHISENGEIFKTFNVKDGMGIKLIIENDIVPVIITGRNSKIVGLRADELGIKEVYQGIHNKLEVLQGIIDRYDISYDNIAYIGDDLNDLEVMLKVGVSFAPADAVEEIKKNVTYVSNFDGGNGAVRECINKILK